MRATTRKRVVEGREVWRVEVGGRLKNGSMLQENDGQRRDAKSRVTGGLAVPAYASKCPRRKKDAG